MEQSFDASQVDESAEIGEGFDLALEGFAFFQLGKNLFLSLFPLILQEKSPGKHGIFRFAVEFDDLEFEALAQQLFGVLDHLDVGMRIGQKRVDPNIDGIPVPDLLLNVSDDPIVVMKRFLQIIQCFDGVGPPFGENEIALLDIASFQDGLNLIPGFQKLHLFSILGIPISTSSAIVGAVAGSGLERGARSVSKKTILIVVIGWVLTPSLAAFSSFLLYKLITMIG